VEARETTRAGLTPEFAGPLLESLVRDSQQLEDLHGEVPAAARARIDATRAKLAVAVERGRTTRRLRIIAGTVLTLLLAVVVIGVGLLAFRASGHAAALAKLRAANSTAAVADLITRVKGQEPLLLRFPALSSAVADAGRWLETATSDAGIAERELERLEQARGDDFATWTAPELAERLEQTAALVAKLPADLGAAAKARLAVLQNDGERNLRKRQETADGQAREAIRKATALLETVDDQSPASAAGQAVEDAETTLAPFLTTAANRQPLLRLPAATETDLADLEKRLATVKGQVEAATSALAELALAKSPNDYRTGLESLAETRFQEAAAARAVLDGWPDDDRVKAFLLFKNNLAALQAARSEVDGELPLPSTATAQDRELIGELMKSETLNGLWEVVWKRSKGPPQNCLSKKELERHGLRSWSGKVAAYPQHPSSELKYVETRLGGTDDVTVIVNRISPVSAMMHQLRVASLLNDSGTEYRSSILPLIDQVTRNREASALARAYVLSRFFKLLRGREQAWGLHYCPELSADIAAFRELEIQWPLIENSWLLETKPAYSKPWEEYFASRGERSFAEPMRRMKSAASSVIGSPLMLAGRVDAGGNLNLVPSPNPRLLLGIGRSKTTEPGPRMVGTAEAGATELNSAAALLPFSPLLTLEVPETDRNFLLTLHP
ncbi:hypothetical protein HQ447_07565, partial [bacterium]|nr:hypothetical protein [bacterium]